MAKLLMTSVGLGFHPKYSAYSVYPHNILQMNFMPEQPWIMDLKEPRSIVTAQTYGCQYSPLDEVYVGIDGVYVATDNGYSMVNSISRQLRSLSSLRS